MNNYDKFQNNYGRLSQQSNERAKNYQDWSDETKAEWHAKPICEAESYYINLKGYVATLKKSPRNGIKPRALIAKKKKWRDGLLNLLCNDPDIGKYYRNAELKKTVASIQHPKPKPSAEQKGLREQRARQDLHCDEELEDTEENDPLIKK